MEAFVSDDSARVRKFMHNGKVSEHEKLAPCRTGGEGDYCTTDNTLVDLSLSRVPLSQKGLFLRGLVFYHSYRVKLCMSSIIDASFFLRFVFVCDKDMQAAVSIFQLVSFATKLRLHPKSTSRADGLGSRVGVGGMGRPPTHRGHRWFAVFNQY